MFSRVYTYVSVCTYVSVYDGDAWWIRHDDVQHVYVRIACRSRACARVGGARVRIRTARLISRANLRACIQWVSAVNASNHPPAMATRGYYYRRAGRYSFHLQLWRVRVQRPWEFAGSSARDSLLESGASTRTVATLHFQIIDDRANAAVNTATRNPRRTTRISEKQMDTHQVETI